MKLDISIPKYISWQKLQADNTILIIDEKRKISHELEGVVVDIWLYIVEEISFNELTAKHNCSYQEATAAIHKAIRILRNKKILKEAK